MESKKREEMDAFFLLQEDNEEKSNLDENRKNMEFNQKINYDEDNSDHIDPNIDENEFNDLIDNEYYYDNNFKSDKQLEKEILEEIKKKEFENKKNDFNCCFHCENKYTKCSNCNGIFDIDFFQDKHFELCKKLDFESSIILNYIPCIICKAFFEAEDYEKHLECCRLRKFEEIKKFECRYCLKLIDKLKIDYHEKECLEYLNKNCLINMKSQCPHCYEDFPEIILTDHIKSCENLKRKNEDLMKKQSSMMMTVEYPSDWIFDKENLNSNIDKDSLKILVDNEISYISLDRNTYEYKNIEESLNKKILEKNLALNIKEIKKIQNKSLYKKYETEKIKIIEEKKLAKERSLYFYDPEITINYLIRNGFDISFSNDYSEFGRGIYFSKEAQNLLCLIENKLALNSNRNNFIQVNNQNLINFNQNQNIKNIIKRINFPNNNYSNNNNIKKKEKYIVISKVITGLKILLNQPNNTLKKPPFYDNENTIHFDSVKNRKTLDYETQTTYVIYDNDKAYPEYIVEFC